MLYRDICRTLSFYLWILAIPLCIPLCMAIYCEWMVGPEHFPQPPSAFAFLFTIACTLALGALFSLVGQRSRGHLYRREALLLVLLVYLLTPIVGGLPFFFNRTLTNPVDAVFEAVSGLTTTGATIMEAKRYDPYTDHERPIEKTFNVGEKATYTFYGTIAPIVDPETGEILYEGLEAISPALLFWRCFMQWLGGGGIIVLFVAILPALGVGGKVLFQAEVTGPTKESIFPRIKDTANQLWKVYLGLTILETVLLMLTNSKISLFDAITLAFSTLSTGGFTANSAGIEAYHNAYTDWVIIVFMILGSTSFSIYFLCMRGKFNRLKDSELRLFVLIIFFATAFAIWQLMAKLQYPDALETLQEASLSFFDILRNAAFQVISFQTSTGFSIANYDLWPFSLQVLLLILMFVGGMAGSTAGGLKIIRYRMFYQIMSNKIESIYRPDTVRTFSIGTSTLIDNRTAITVLCFFLVAALFTISGTFLLVLDGVDPETGFTSISCMLNNVGIAFRMGGPTQSFAFLSNFGKIISMLWMIAGRLEYFVVLIVCVPAFWRTTY